MICIDKKIQPVYIERAGELRSMDRDKSWPITATLKGYKGGITTMETTLRVSGMHCTACKMLVEDAINEIPGAKAITVDHTTGTVTVSYDSEATLEKIRLAIRGEGFTV